MTNRIMLTIAGALALLPPLASPLRAADAPDNVKAYPAEVALDEEGDKGYIYRRFPGAQRLYFYDKDAFNKSNCNIGCDGPRPPVYVACSTKALPDWSILTRYNGLCQWAFKGHPLYTFYHDLPSDPKGDGEGGVWHLVPFNKTPDLPLR